MIAVSFNKFFCSRKSSKRPNCSSEEEKSVEGLSKLARTILQSGSVLKKERIPSVTHFSEPRWAGGTPVKMRLSVVGLAKGKASSVRGAITSLEFGGPGTFLKREGLTGESIFEKSDALSLLTE